MIDTELPELSDLVILIQTQQQTVKLQGAVPKFMWKLNDR